MDSQNPDQERPRTLRYEDLITNMLSYVTTATGVDSHEPKPGDVCIATFPKSGTALVQTMLWHLVIQSGGGPEGDPDGTNYKDLNDVVPVIDLFPMSGIKPGGTTPRIYATHSPIPKLDVDNKEYRYIYVYRDGHKIPGSSLDFILPWTNPGVKFSEDDYQRIYHEYLRNVFLLGNMLIPQNYVVKIDSETNEENQTIPGDAMSWFDHVKGWTEKRRENLLVLQYEKVAKDITGTARTIADFLGLKVSEEGYQKVAAFCDREYMSKDPRLKELALSKKMGWDPKGAGRARMDGKGGFRDQKFDDEEEEVFRQQMRNTFGVEDYPALVKLIERIHGGENSGT